VILGLAGAVSKSVTAPPPADATHRYRHEPHRVPRYRAVTIGLTTSLNSDRTALSDTLWQCVIGAVVLT